METPMIELVDDTLVFSFPEVHPDATLRVTFQRTLRIPDDGRTYPLPPGLGAFPLRHVDDHAKSVPPSWQAHGGVLLPMYQAEALWVQFAPGRRHRRFSGYPFAVKVAAGKINAVTGGSWSNELRAKPQDYMVAPAQPWLDGFAVSKGVIRQFVAMPLGGGYTAEEQITGAAEHGGLQILVCPMKRDCYERRFHRIERVDEMISMSMPAPAASLRTAAASMGLAPGGRMRQEIYDDPYGIEEWDTTARSRCFVHLLNTMMWEAVTGTRPPLPPPIAATYAAHGLPWYDYYAEGQRALDGSATLNELRSVIDLAREKGVPALPENESFSGERVVRITPRTRDEVRDGVF
jgi:hypothetical protein